MMAFQKKSYHNSYFTIIPTNATLNFTESPWNCVFFVSKGVWDLPWVLFVRQKKTSRTTSSETWMPDPWWVGKTWGVEAGSLWTAVTSCWEWHQGPFFKVVVSKNFWCSNIFDVKKHTDPGWWFLKYIFFGIFTPTIWGRWTHPFWRGYFSIGLVQPPTNFCFDDFPKMKVDFGGWWFKDTWQMCLLFFVVNWLLDVVLPFLRFNCWIAKNNVPCYCKRPRYFKRPIYLSWNLQKENSQGIGFMTCLMVCRWCKFFATFGEWQPRHFSWTVQGFLEGLYIYIYFFSHQWLTCRNAYKHKSRSKKQNFVMTSNDTWYYSNSFCHPKKKLN